MKILVYILITKRQAIRPSNADITAINGAPWLSGFMKFGVIPGGGDAIGELNPCTGLFVEAIAPDLKAKSPVLRH